MMSTPGISGRCGKCPGKNGSLNVTFFSATQCCPATHSSTRSTNKKGYRCGNCRMIASISNLSDSDIISPSVQSSQMRDHSPPQSRFHGRHAARIAAGVLDRGTHQAAPPDHHISRTGQVAGKSPPAAHHATSTDHRAAGNARAGGNRGVGTYGHVVAYLDLIIQFDT